MAIIIFPPNPNQGDTFTADNGVVYTYDGVKWEGATGNLLNVTTDVIPSVDATYNLGNSTNQWQDVWVSGNVEASYFLGNGSQLTGISGGANTGQISFVNTTISGPSTFDSTPLSVILQAGSSQTATGNIVGGSLYLKPGQAYLRPPGNVYVGLYNPWTFQDLTGNLIMPSNTSSINYANGQPYGGSGGNASTGNFVFSGDDMLMPLFAKLNSGGIGNTNAAEFGTEVISNGTAIVSSQIYMGAGTTEIRGIVDTAGAGLMYAGVEGMGFAGTVGMDPNVTSQYAIAVGPGNTILLGAATGNGELTTTEYTAGVGALNTNGTINGLLASSSNVVISNGNTAGWSFGADGNLTLPGSINGSGSITINPDPANSNLAWAFADFGANTAIFIAPNSDEANVGLIILPGSDGSATVSWAGNSNLTPLANTLLLNSSNAVTIATNGLRGNTLVGNKQWLFDNAGNLILPAGGIISDTGNDGITLKAATPPTTIVITGADFVAVNTTYTRDLGETIPTWYPAGYVPGTNSYILFDGTWGIYNPGFVPPLYVNTGTITAPLTQWDTNPPLGSVAPTGAYTYSNPAWLFGGTGNLTLPTNTSSINYANGQPYGGTGTGYSNAEVATFLADYGSNSISSTGSITAGSITQGGIGNINGYNGYFANNLTAQGTVQATSFVSPTGNGTFYGNANTGLDALYAGLPGFTVLGTDVIAQFSANVDSYAQINLQNINTGNLASADYIITADIGNNSSYYLDLGLASSTHNDPYFFGDVGFANDGYLTVVGPDYAGPSTANGPGNLVLGSSNGLIKMFVGNASQANVIATVSSSGLNVLGNITTAGDSGNITGANVISANTLTALSITQTGTGNINGYNGYFANNVTVQGTLQATGLIVPQGNGTFFGNSVSGNSALFAGVPGYTVLGSNVVVQFAGNANSYSQVNFQNIDSGSAATTDYIATADAGTDSTYYLDMGIAGSTYDNTNPNVSLGTSLFPLDSYVFSAGSTNLTPGGNLVVGTITPERVISFIAGGVNDTEIVQIIANTGISVYRPISSTGNIIAGNISTLETGGNITGNTVTAATAVVTTPTTVDNLPSAVAAGPGARSFVIDSNTITFYSNVGNAGSNSVPVFSDGTSWRVG
jgi:hypothetical protein